MLAITRARCGHPKNLITQGALGSLKPLLKQGLPKSPELLFWPRLRFLLYAGNGGFDRANIGPQVPALGSSGNAGGYLGTTWPLCVADPRIFADCAPAGPDTRPLLPPSPR